jgi:hypothetical protein
LCLEHALLARGRCALQSGARADAARFNLARARADAARFDPGRRMIRGMRLALLYLLCAPWNVGTLLLGGALVPLGVAGLRRAHGVLWLDVRTGSLLARRFRYSITLGHVVVLQPGLAGSCVERHELVHVRQYEGAVCSVWLMALTASACHAVLGPVGALAVVLLFGPWWSYAGASVAALLRGQRAYLDNHFERHARAEVEARGSTREPNEPARGSAREPNAEAKHETSLFEAAAAQEQEALSPGSRPE